MSFSLSEYTKKSMSAGASPQTPLGELTEQEEQLEWLFGTRIPGPKRTNNKTN